jgi:hypothetical protein
MTLDFTSRYKNYSIFTPAISEMYTRLECQPKPKREFPIPQHDLNFLDPKNGLFHITHALFSAGQAAKSQSAADKIDCMITGRDRSYPSTIIGDSGGYQIETGAIKWEGDKTRQRMMKWLENNCTWSMILDFPTGGINIGNVDQHLKRLEAEGADIRGFCNDIGFNSNDHQKLAFATCLYQTIENNEYFVKHMTPGKTKFLNVLQGRNVEESDVWYDKVKHFPFAAWSLAGPHKENFEMTMRRIIMMRDDNLLQDKDWIHILGVGKMSCGAVYSTIQENIRKYVNPKLTISFDVSSPFTLAAYGKLFFGYQIDKSGWSLSGDKVDGSEFLPGGPRAKVPFLEHLREHWLAKGLDKGANSRFVETEVGKLITMDQFCVNDDPKFTASWDVISYGIGMNHNLQVQLEAIFDAQDAFAAGDTERVPEGLLKFKKIIPEIFQSETPYDLIKRYRKDLNYLAGDTAERGVQELSEFDMPSISSHLKSLDKLTTLNMAQPSLELVSDIFM